MSAGMSGVFYVSELATKDGSSTPAFCKPINIQIYSAPPPVRMRVVTYDIVYWSGSTQPNVIEEWHRLERYVSPKGLSSLSFSMGTLPTSLSHLLSEIRRHFHAAVLKGRAVRSKQEGIDRLLGMNSDDKTVTVDDDNDVRRIFRVYDVHHVEIVKIDLDKEHYVDTEKLRYHANIFDGVDRYGMEEKYITASVRYEDNRTLFNQALRHLRCDETLSKIKRLANAS